VVWHAASKAVEALSQGVRFPPLPPSVGSPVVGQRSVTPRRFGACRFESCPTDHCDRRAQKPGTFILTEHSLCALLEGEPVPSGLGVSTMRF
jgi:hypothetical protein